MDNLFKSNYYYLYNKNNKIAKFECIYPNNEPEFVFIEQYGDFLPFGFDKNDVTQFIKSRKAPSNRAHIKEILNKCGRNNLEGLIRFSYCASLNDTFWIKPEDKENINWDNVSLYRNKFNENIARIAFNGGLMGEQISTATPEITTDGSFPKCWKRIGETIYLFKKNGIAGRETLSESMAYEIGKIICQNPTRYDLFNYHSEITARCKIFTDENISYVPIVRILGHNASFQKCLDYFTKMGEEDKFKEMMVLDALTLNTDRHLKNFGILYHSETGEFISMAPVFDNNLSMLPFAHIDDLNNFKEYLPTRPCAFDDDFNKIAISCLTNNIKDSLQKIEDFSFSGNPFYEEERLSLLTKIIKTQAHNIIKGNTLTYYMPDQTKIAPISLDSLNIIIDKSQLSPNDINMLTLNDYEIPDFDILLDNNTKLHITNIQSDIIELEHELCLEIYAAKITNDTTNCELANINALNNFQIKNKKNSNVDYSYMKLKVKEISVQLTKGIKQNISSLEDYSILINCDNNIKDINKTYNYD